MLVNDSILYRITDADREVFRLFVPQTHRLRVAEREIDWENLRPILEAYYCPNRGQPAIDPVRMLKIEFLRHLHNLSDREVIERLETDIAFRFFLLIGNRFCLPDPSSLCRFRARLGKDGFSKIFNELVAQARALGLVKDRLRLKDASHVVANIAVPTTLKLVAQIRDRLLAAIEPMDKEWVDGQRIEADLIRERTKGGDDALRLEIRVKHLRDLTAWAEQLSPDDPSEAKWCHLDETLKLTKKILADRDNPKRHHKTLSVHDPDAHRGKHGEWYDGYIVDILEDPDSGIVTQLNVLEAGGDEARDAVDLVIQEQKAHGNQIESISIDGAGYNGEMLRTLEGKADDPEDSGLGVVTYVPPKPLPASERFTSEDFTMNEDGTSVICPAGESSAYRQRDTGRNAAIFRFTRQTCDSCPLQQQCLARPSEGPFGRSVTKNDHQAEYQRTIDRSMSEEYADIRKEHMEVERKLNELLNHRGGRHARYRGKPKVLIQELMAGFVMNANRIMHFAKKLFADTSENRLATEC